MLPSLKDQFVADTYHGLLHTANKPLSAGLQTVYDGFGNESKLQLSKNGVRVGNLNIPTVAGQSGEVIGVVGDDIGFVSMFPIGAVYFTANNMNPSSFLGGTWLNISQGRFIVGVGTGTDSNGDAKTFTQGTNEGEYQHSISIDEMPLHKHNVLGRQERFGRTNSSSKLSTGSDITQKKGETDTVGGGLPHNNTPPSFGLYVWQRTA